MKELKPVDVRPRGELGLMLALFGFIVILAGFLGTIGSIACAGVFTYALIVWIILFALCGI